MHGITSTTDAGLLFVFKACPVFITGAPQQAHSELCNCCGNAEDGQQDKSIVEVISCTFLSIKTIETHRSRIAEKIGTNNIAALTKFAIRHGLTGLDS